MFKKASLRRVFAFKSLTVKSNMTNMTKLLVMITLTMWIRMANLCLLSLHLKTIIMIRWATKLMETEAYIETLGIATMGEMEQTVLVSVIQSAVPEASGRNSSTILIIRQSMLSNRCKVKVGRIIPT